MLNQLGRTRFWLYVTGAFDLPSPDVNAMVKNINAAWTYAWGRIHFTAGSRSTTRRRAGTHWLFDCPIPCVQL